MAIDSTMVWEVRTTGSQNNGGGFKPAATGTDYSQQNAAQDSGTDLACADGNAASPEITSATHNFVAADVGNIVHITAGTGWTAGWYEIVSVAANAATMDRAVGTDGAKTSGTWYLGGAYSTLDTSFMASNKTTGNTVYVKTGTYDIAAHVNSIGAIVVEGYQTTRGDTPTGANRPTINMSTYYFSGESYFLRNFIFTGSYAFVGASTGVVNISGGRGIIRNCKIENTSTSADPRALSLGGSVVISCELKSQYGRAIHDNGGGRIINCYIHDSVIGIITVTGVTDLIAGCVIDTCTTGIDGTIWGDGGVRMCFNNTIYNCTTGLAIEPATTDESVMFNNIISACATGLNGSGTASNYSYLDFNCWNNTADKAGTQFSDDTDGASDVPLRKFGIEAITGDPEMTSPATDVFTISSDSIAAKTALDASTYSGCTV